MDDATKVSKPAIFTAADFGEAAARARDLGVPVGYLVTPGSIQRSEAQGQQELVVSAVLPVDMQPDRASFEALGFTFGEPDPNDRLFVPATLPQGWRKGTSDHAMWSHVIDDQGRQRVTVFYKAAFYDRRAHMSLVPRYGLDQGDSADAWHVTDKAAGHKLFGPASYEEARAWLQANLSEKDRYNWAT